MGGHPRSQPPPPTHKPPVLRDYEDDYVQPRSFDEPEAVAPTVGDGEAASASTGPKEPVSALDYYEKAVEREAAGSLGDSLKLYRKAFRVSYGLSVTLSSLVKGILKLMLNANYRWMIK